MGAGEDGVKARTIELADEEVDAGDDDGAERVNEHNVDLVAGVVKGREAEVVMVMRKLEDAVEANSRGHWP